MKITWAADVLRAVGLDVWEMPGWKTRETKPGFDPQGIVLHHTATKITVPDLKVAELLRDGRPAPNPLPGPLSQFGLERSGRWVCVAAGRCNHNGYGIWGNDSIGVEAYNDGVGEPWNNVQMTSYAIGCAALAEEMNWTIAQIRGHKETDPTRKIDPTFNCDIFRVNVQRIMDEPTPKIGGNEMWFGKAIGTPAVYCFDGGTFFHIRTKAEGVAIAASAGQTYKVAEISETTLNAAKKANTKV